MHARSGKMPLIIIVLLVMLFLAFVVTPLALVPRGPFAGFAHGLRSVSFDAWPFEHWFPLVPAFVLAFLFLILWIAVIVWVFTDAEKRGMSGLLWALLVFFGHLIGLIVFLIVRQDHPVGGAPATSGSSAPPAPQRTSPGPETAALPAVSTAGQAPLTCPSCQKPVEKAFVYCPHCGTALQPVCRNCGRPVAADWKTCAYCGAALGTE